MQPALESVSFTVFGPPRPKERARVTMRGAYTPKRTKQYQRAVGEVALMSIGRSWPLEGVYRVTCLFVFAGHRHPDGDNCEKAVLDALQGIAYKNDRQVMGSSWEKLVEPGRRPRTEVLLERIGDGPRKARRA